MILYTQEHVYIPQSIVCWDDQGNYGKVKYLLRSLLNVPCKLVRYLGHHITCFCVQMPCSWNSPVGTVCHGGTLLWGPCATVGLSCGNCLPRWNFHVGTMCHGVALLWGPCATVWLSCGDCVPRWGSPMGTVCHGGALLWGLSSTSWQRRCLSAGLQHMSPFAGTSVVPRAKLGSPTCSGMLVEEVLLHLPGTHRSWE